MFATRGLRGEPVIVIDEGESATPLPAPLVKPTPTPSPGPSGNNVATQKESQLAQRIYNLHQKRKAARKLGLETDEERRRFQEYAKFLMAYVTTYAPPNGRLREDVKANLLQVVRETPGMMPGIGLAPVAIFGLVLRLLAWGAGFIFGTQLLDTVDKNLSLDEKREETRYALIQQGRSADEIKKIMDAGGNGGGSQAGFLGNVGDIMQYALWGVLLYFGWQIVEPMLKKRRRASA